MGTPVRIAVDADGKRVPKDPTNGWEYGPNMTSIVLNGSWCTGLQNATITNVQTIFACAGVLVHAMPRITFCIKTDLPLPV